ncbi:MAG: alpha/beta hydrolase, partial [Phototrophicaceae bacterium]
IEHHGLREVIAIGHSFGGIASALAVKERPDLFRALILLDPTILDPASSAELARLRASNAPPESYPLAARALRRQDTFAHRSEAFDYLRSRGVFKDWNHAALSQYVDAGLVQTDAGFVLAWPKEWEAYYFRTIYPNFRNDIPALNGVVPTLIVRGEMSDTYVEGTAAEVARLWPAATHTVIAGEGHLFPQTAAEQTSEVLQKWLSSAL